jgi:phage-related protein
MKNDMNENKEKPIVWVGRSKEDLLEFPQAACRSIGYALHEVQHGDKPAAAKPFKGFKGAAVLEIVERHNTDTYRAVYTVQFEDAVYVLHCFQKKSKSGIATPPKDIELIASRLKIAIQLSKGQNL